MNAADFDLSHFLEAQENSYPVALKEIRLGRKVSHWIWYIFPQLRSLGLSSTSEKYGLSGLAEARTFLAHPILGARLRESTEAMLAHPKLSAHSVLGELDAAKFRSCLTLFVLAEPSEQVFRVALQRFFAAAPDPKTIELLGARGEA